MRLLLGGMALVIAAVGAVAGAAGLEVIGGPGEVATIGVSGPVAPVPLTVEYDDGAVDLEWTAVPGASSYRVLRSEGGSFSLIASVGGTAYSDGGVVPGGSYAYRVYSVGPDGAVSADPAEGHAAVPDPGEAADEVPSEE